MVILTYNIFYFMLFLIILPSMIGYFGKTPVKNVEIMVDLF